MSSLLNSFWDSPEVLGIALRWITIVGILLTATFAIAAYVVNDRISALQSEVILRQGQQLTSQNKIVEEQATELSHLKGSLNEAEHRAAVLAKRAQDAERGVSDTYDFNGTHRQTVSGRTIVSAGSETDVFRKMIEAYDEQNWANLLQICEKQILLSPKWLTPYLFSGVANGRLGDLSKAKERLQFVTQNAGNDPNYADATRILREIESKPTP